MLRIAAHQQQRLWGCSGDWSVLSRRGVCVEVAACKRTVCRWERCHLGSSGRSSSNNILKGRSRRREKAVMMTENSSVEQRSPDALELETLIAGGPGLTRNSTLSSKINKSSKWVVIVLVTGGVLWRHDDHAVWFAVGAAVNGSFCKCLKYLINQNRPSTANGVKVDPGMPSSHAQGFAFVGSYVLLAWLHQTLNTLAWVSKALHLLRGVNVWTSTISLGILLIFAYLAWLRVLEGLHSVPQVLVGSTLGSAVGALWLYIWKAGAEAAVEKALATKHLLYMTFFAGCATSYFTHLKDWDFGRL